LCCRAEANFIFKGTVTLEQELLIDWQASKEEWIGRIRAELLARLLADGRLQDVTRMAQRFDAAVALWRTSGDFRPVINDGNELCAADQILRDLGPADRLRYEPKLSRTPKSIDFCVEWKTGGRSWVDMKTVAPGWQDDEEAWARIQRIAADLPDDNHLILDRALGGAALGGQWLKARWSFIQRAIELEAKIALLTDAERGPVRLLLCSEGAWHCDDLEDFADFYRTGSFRADDWAQKAIARYMSERNLKFGGSIAGFCYLERRHDEVVARKFVVDVKGPTMFAPIVKNGGAK
jgi:hypothetical protein